MLAALQPHPDTPCKAVHRIDVEVTRNSDRLLLLYSVVGQLDAIVWPPPAEMARADELWKHTCFEAFIREQNQEAYREINLSPSSQWGAYVFDGYRAGMRPDSTFEPSAISAKREASHATLEANIDTRLETRSPWLLGLSAVIEETSGAKSYWALKHPPGKPDFHHADGFILELP
jgi:hypothetical protein